MIKNKNKYKDIFKKNVYFNWVHKNIMTSQAVMLSALLDRFDPLWPLYRRSLNCAGYSDLFRSHRQHKQTRAEPKLPPPNP